MEKKDLLAQLPLGRHLAMLAKLYFGALTKKLEHLEIERHYSILLILEKDSGNRTQQNLSDFLKIDKAAMVRNLDYLVKKGYIKRTVNTSDRREHYIQLTEKAKRVLPQIHAAVNELNVAVTKGLSKQEAETLRTWLCTINQNLQEMPKHKIIVNFKKSKRD